MVVCELCGRAEELVLAEIEGVELSVCSNCATYGTIKRQRPTIGRSFLSSRVEDQEFRIVADVAAKLRSIRLAKSLTQLEFAALLNQRESIVAKWEQGSVKPSLDEAREIGKKLGIHLLEKEEHLASDLKQKKTDDALTIGDFIKIKK